jgi:hypothetical protein
MEVFQIRPLRVPPFYIGLDKIRRQQKACRNHCVVVQRDLFGLQHQLAPPVEVRLLLRQSVKTVKRWVAVSAVVVSRIRAEEIEKGPGIVEVADP